VWADGLGNPRENAIQRCQVARLAELIDGIQETERIRTGDANANPDPDTPPLVFRFWIDTLCCPVELEGKLISLQRIKDVYKNAVHVLVLDSSLSLYPCQDAHPSEILMRVYASSAWMRRLWTLQGMLSTFLHDQITLIPKLLD
jgi:hypothetical protein